MLFIISSTVVFFLLQTVSAKLDCRIDGINDGAEVYRYLLTLLSFSLFHFPPFFRGGDHSLSCMSVPVANQVAPGVRGVHRGHVRLHGAGGEHELCGSRV